MAGFYYKPAISTFDYSESATLMPGRVRYKIYEDFPGKERGADRSLPGKGTN
jgi:hypothetical protein